MTTHRVKIGLFYLFLGITSIWVGGVLLPFVATEIQYTLRKSSSTIRQMILPQFSINTGPTNIPDNSIQIPSLYLNEPIIENVDANNPDKYNQALKQGVAHAIGTGEPGSDRIGYYFAHSSSWQWVSQYNAVFYLLGNVNIGDTITIKHNNQTYDYEVSTKKITDPTYVSFLTDIYPKETIVLQTCWPPGTTLKRLLVFAQRVT